MTKLSLLEENYYSDCFFKFEIESIQQKALQVKLNQYYNRTLSSPDKFKNIPDDLQELADIRQIENAWNEFEEDRIKNIKLPQSKNEFADWYHTVNQQHKDKVRSFFQYLAKDASLEELAYYICLEEKVDGSFDDMIAMAQMGVKDYMKLVMADNYWDEMGHGKHHEMHTVMFATSANYMKKILQDKLLLQDEGPVGGLKNGNMLMMYAMRRRYILRLLGAIGILEDTASERFSATTAGLTRFKLPYEVIAYHEAHIDIDSNHGIQWFNHVLLPLVQQGDEEVMHEIAKGVLIRFNVAIDYYTSVQQRIEQFKQAMESVA